MYSWSMENGAPSSHIHGKVRSLNSMWGLSWMWEERAPFHYTPGLPKNFSGWGEAFCVGLTYISDPR